jgi:hypothetical protein
LDCQAELLILVPRAAGTQEDVSMVDCKVPETLPRGSLQARAQASVVWEGDLMLSERAAKGPSVGLARVRAVAQQHIWSPGDSQHSWRHQH